MATMAQQDGWVTKVAVVGAGGNLGRAITRALQDTKRHTITALTRTSSTTQLADGLNIKRVDYDRPETLLDALSGQDALVITLSGRSAIPETEEKLVRAAAEAGVPWIMPNEWSPDTKNEALVRDVPMFQPKVATRKLISELDKSSYISLCTGFWYDYTLPNPHAFGFDIANRTAKFFDDGKTPISISTLDHVGRAVAAILSLPVSTCEIDSESTLTLSSMANKTHYTSSFTVSQQDMFSSLLRATDTKEDDWSVSYESARERYAAGLVQMQRHEWVGFAKVMYGRVFFDDGCGDFEQRALELGLGIKENLDAVTASVVAKSKMIEH